jgi:hypothetical protein
MTNIATQIAEGLEGSRDELYDQLIDALVVNGIDRITAQHAISKNNTDYHNGEYGVGVQVRFFSNWECHRPRKFTPRRFATLVQQITAYLGKHGYVRRGAEGGR